MLVALPGISSLYSEVILTSIWFAEKVLRHEDLQGAPLLILANKQVIFFQSRTVKEVSNALIA